MFTKHNRLVSVVLLAVLGVLTVAEAQSKPQTMPPTVPRSIEVNTLRPGNHVGRSMTDTRVLPDFSTGWNFVHPQNCVSYYYGGYFYIVVYFQEGGDIYTSDVNFQTALYGACQAGNWIAFYIYDGYGDWNETYTYTYQ
jgi:hypothetical protein